MAVLMYSNKTMIWREKEGVKDLGSADGLSQRSVGYYRMDSAPNAQVRELCGVLKGMDERINESSPIVRVLGVWIKY